MAFTRADREWFFNPQTSHVAYGEIEWRFINGVHRGKLVIAEGYGSAHHPEFVLMLRPPTPWMITLTVSLGGACLARVDVNGPHREGRVVRTFTHRQIHNLPNAAPETEELRGFPVVPDPRVLEFDLQMWVVLEAAAPYLNLDISGVDRQIPFPALIERGRS